MCGWVCKRACERGYSSGRRYNGRPTVGSFFTGVDPYDKNQDMVIEQKHVKTEY